MKIGSFGLVIALAVASPALADQPPTYNMIVFRDTSASEHSADCRNMMKAEKTLELAIRLGDTTQYVIPLRAIAYTADGCLRAVWHETPNGHAAAVPHVLLIYSCDWLAANDTATHIPDCKKPEARDASLSRRDQP